MVAKVHRKDFLNNKISQIKVMLGVVEPNIGNKPIMVIFRGSFVYKKRLFASLK